MGPSGISPTKRGQVHEKKRHIPPTQPLTRPRAGIHAKNKIKNQKEPKKLPCSPCAPHTLNKYGLQGIRLCVASQSIMNCSRLNHPHELLLLES